MQNKPIKNIQNGKGSKFRPTNLKAYSENYDEIDWGYAKICCCECGMPLKDKKIRNNDGTFQCIQCNFN